MRSMMAEDLRVNGEGGMKNEETRTAEAGMWKAGKGERSGRLRSRGSVPAEESDR